MIHLAFTDPVLERIHQVEDRMGSQADNHHPELASALRHLLRSGGKRIRVALTLLMGGMLNADPDRLVTLSAAIELLHTATLVHDDLIDGSLMRRGLPTLNSRWSPAATVLTGDFIFARAAKLAADVESIPVTKLFAETLATIVNGEIGQMFGRRGMVTIDEYYQRIYAKTASLFETSTYAAALMSTTNQEVIDRARQFGYDLGMAFQIIDDILDFTGEQATVGKPVANDLRQGLATLPIILYQQKYSDDPALDEIFADFPDDALIMGLVERVRKSDAIESAFAEANKFIEHGLAVLASFPDSQEKEALKELTQFIVSRRK